MFFFKKLGFKFQITLMIPKTNLYIFLENFGYKEDNFDF